MSKGSGIRIKDYKKFRNNYDKVFKKSSDKKIDKKEDKHVSS